MTRRALLIGAQTFGLQGVEHDVAAMTAALQDRDFRVRRCQGPQATRDGIIGAYEQLITETGRGDVALVYYSGHGGYAWPMAGETVEVAHTNRQFLVPTDFDESAGFRGITAVELSVLLGRLTAKTTNAVVALDCCHSALMSRDFGELRSRALPRVVRVDIEGHLRRQLGAGLRIDLASPMGNPNAVRLVACAADQSAYERPRTDGPGAGGSGAGGSGAGGSGAGGSGAGGSGAGGSGAGGSGTSGVFTDALIRALDETAATRVSWSWLIRRVRELVGREVMTLQRPEAEGPAQRRIFEVAGDDATGSAGSLPVIIQDGRARIDGAALLGVQVGDEFLIKAFVDQEPIAGVRIDAVDLTAAYGRPAYVVPGTLIPPDARAYRIVATAPRIAARVPAELAAAVDRSTFVQVAGPVESAPIEVVRSSAGELTVRDAIGPLHAPRPPGLDAERRSVEDLNRIARASILRGLGEHATFAPPVTLEWGLTVAGRPHPLPLTGATVHPGDLIYLKVRNDSIGPFYVSLIDIGVSYAITPLTDLAPSGLKIPPGGEYVYGADDWTGQLVGIQLTWPEGLDRRAPRPETVLALITTEPQDISPLQQYGVRGVTPLSDLLAYFGAGASRDLRRPPYFCAPAFAFTLDPVRRPAPPRPAPPAK
jgi:hypothetical protein